MGSDMLDFLSDVSIFNELSENELKPFTEYFSERTYPKNSMIIIDIGSLTRLCNERVNAILILATSCIIIDRSSPDLLFSHNCELLRHGY